MKQVFDTREDAGDAIAEMLADLDVYAAYRVHTGNAGYSAETNGARFVNGRADIEALSPDAKPREVTARELQLKWFLNCEPKEVTQRIVVDEDLGTKTAVYGWRLAYRLERQGDIESKPGRPVSKKEAVPAALSREA